MLDTCAEVNDGVRHASKQSQSPINVSLMVTIVGSIRMLILTKYDQNEVPITIFL